MSIIAPIAFGALGGALVTNFHQVCDTVAEVADVVWKNVSGESRLSREFAKQEAVAEHRIQYRRHLEELRAERERRQFHEALEKADQEAKAKAEAEAARLKELAEAKAKAEAAEARLQEVIQENNHLRSRVTNLQALPEQTPAPESEPVVVRRRGGRKAAKKA